MSRPSKKPKYKLDPKKFIDQETQAKEKKNDWNESDLYQEMLRSKSRHRH